MTWWRSAVFYQIYPRSFADTNGDGVGDLGGIRAHLEYLQWLGVDALWLSPIYPSPMKDFGYDVADYQDVEPMFGSLGEFDALVQEAHQRDLKLTVDWVANHTSSQHPWFMQSRSTRSAAKRDWYFWREGRNEGPPNNWTAAFGGPAWTYDNTTRQWYLHLFLPDQPDLNWGNPEVQAAMHDVLRFWLDRGVDGFRADVIHLIGKDEQLSDRPHEVAHIDVVGVHDHPRTHELLRDIRKVLDAYDGDRVIVGEVSLETAHQLAPYYGSGDELHMVFNFSLLHTEWDAEAWLQRIAAAEAAFDPEQAWPVWVLSNHDQHRHRSRYGGAERRARVAAAVLLTLRGTPFLFAGEEIGLLDAEVGVQGRIDPGGRDGCRAPIPWDSSHRHGWPGVAPWMPFPPEAQTRNIADQRDDDRSILHVYRRLLQARRSSKALQLGTWRPLDAPKGTLAYERRHNDDVRVVVANFTSSALSGVVDHDDYIVDVGTERDRDEQPWDGHLRAEEAVVLRPRNSDAAAGATMN